jgi:hypothetical protein
LQAHAVTTLESEISAGAARNAVVVADRNAGQSASVALEERPLGFQLPSLNTISFPSSEAALNCHIDPPVSSGDGFAVCENAGSIPNSAAAGHAVGQLTSAAPGSNVSESLKSAAAVADQQSSAAPADDFSMSLDTELPVPVSPSIGVCGNADRILTSAAATSHGVGPTTSADPGSDVCESPKSATAISAHVPGQLDFTPAAKPLSTSRGADSPTALTPSMDVRIDANVEVPPTSAATTSHVAEQAKSRPAVLKRPDAMHCLPLSPESVASASTQLATSMLFESSGEWSMPHTATAHIAGNIAPAVGPSDSSTADSTDLPGTAGANIAHEPCEGVPFPKFAPERIACAAEALFPEATGKVKVRTARVAISTGAQCERKYSEPELAECARPKMHILGKVAPSTKVSHKNTKVSGRMYWYQKGSPCRRAV